ncbi:MAG: alanine--tRNA ligase [Pseudomonadales bacterium]|nr:alanine--tRNA ligase [Pseudomonadales bacterium]
MKTAEIRSAFLKFYEDRGHKILPSSSLVPQDDPSLLFTNSGMVQFKEALNGREDVGASRVTTAQRCVRAGGKHNDLENVGYTARHHTLFEMLGNFSFGDYFKEETIAYAWEFLTTVLKLSEDRLWITVHPSDDVSRKIWIEKIGIDPQRVVDLEENFWAAGDTGPCGNCTEIFFDHGSELEGGPPGSPDEDGDRYTEIQNLVFPENNRNADGTLTPLAAPGVDTGMGLERVAAILQGVHSNYEIDIFARLIQEVGKLAGLPKGDQLVQHASLRVIADHIRSVAFLIADGVQPGNEDRSYVLRRIIRRALRHGHKMGINEYFLFKLVDPLVEVMGDAYPLLREQQKAIEASILKEEQRFEATLDKGMVLLERSIKDLSGTVIPGDIVFQLYDTYGFPVDLTADIARERSLEIDESGFNIAMEAQRARGRASKKFAADMSKQVNLESSVDFKGYDLLETEAEIIALYCQNDKGILEQVNTLQNGETGVVVLDQTPFYAESGGQVGDTGDICLRSDSDTSFEVSDTRLSRKQYLHMGILRSGVMKVQDVVRASVSHKLRARTVLNHSATHLLHAALRQKLGKHVEQKGSLVDARRLRFDFSHSQPLSASEIADVENSVNTEIRRNSLIETSVLSYDDAILAGAMALFGEKYSDQVRMLSMGDGFSVELCGGTHADRTGDIGLIKIVSESGIASGVRRIEALAGESALEWLGQGESEFSKISRLLRVGRDDTRDKVVQLLETQKLLQKELDQLRAKQSTQQGADLVDAAIEVNGIPVLAIQVDSIDSAALLKTLDSVRNKLGRSVVLLAMVEDDKVNLIAGISKDLCGTLKAGDLIKTIAPIVGAKGGGRPDMARAGGGSNLQAVPEALEAVIEWVKDNT